MKTVQMLAMTLFLAAPTSHADDRVAAPLQDIVQCMGHSEFRAEVTDRLPPNALQYIDAAQGQVPVSPADGYRVMLYRKSSAPLVTLRIERSIAGKFDADRAAIVQQMNLIHTSSKGPRQMAIERSTQDGIEVAGMNHPAIGTPGVISLYQLFDAPTGTIATASLLSQAPAVREFKTQAEYNVLRDRFISTLSACMAHPQQPAGGAGS